MITLSDYINLRLLIRPILLVLIISSSPFSCTGQGMVIDSINALINSLQIMHTQASAIDIRSALRDGIVIDQVGDDGIQIGLTNDDGISISLAGEDGIFISSAGRHGLHVDEAQGEGIRIFSAGADGIYIDNTVANGMYINDSGEDGVHIANADDDGFEVVDCDDDGLSIGYARGNGIRVGNADEYSMDIQGDKRGIASVENHIARLFNFNDEGGGDVLAIKVNQTDDPTATTNFITFFKAGPDNSTSNALGAIEGNGSGGVTFKTNGADFAEALAQISTDELINPGDVVGIYNGRISLNTDAADRVMAVTDRPAIIGNHQYSDDGTLTQNVSFIGQIPVRVKGPVRSGDWIIPSGLNDGTAISCNPDSLTYADQVIGQAWESNLNHEVKLINTLVGLDHGNSKNKMIRILKDQLEIQKEVRLKQQNEIDNLKIQLELLKHQLENINTRIKN